MLHFEADKQTLKDLNIFPGQSGERSIFSLFQGINTFGAKAHLEDMLSLPFVDPVSIRERSEAIRFFQIHNLRFVSDRGAMELIEHYVKLSKDAIPPGLYSKWKSLKAAIKPKRDDYLVRNGIRLLKEAMGKLQGFIASMDRDGGLPPLLARENQSALALIQQVPKGGLYELHYFFRISQGQQTKRLLELMYDYEVFSVVARTAERYSWCYPKLLDQEDLRLMAKGLVHPLLEGGKPNDLDLPGKNGIYFLTGANMAGKSTWLKAVGIATYLAHTGFPVPASQMEFTLFHGLISTINLNDQIDKGLSHFYAEVQRVKHAAEKIKTRGRMLVVFDELFKGTNVKDAFDASSSIIQAFSKVKDSLFLISTHILEVAAEVKADFYCFQTRLESGVPVYDYVLRNGVSADRLGLVILKNSGVLEIIGEAAGRQVQPFVPVVQPGEEPTSPII